MLSVTSEASSICREFYIQDDASLGEYGVLTNPVTRLSFPAEEITQTLYFFGSSTGSTPSGNSLQVTATVDYLGHVTEWDEFNNTTPSDAVP